MQDLKFVRIENDCLVVADDLGELYSVAVDDAVLSGIRQVAKGDHQSKVSPALIQSLIRAGKSATEVAAETGADPADVERFEAPVIAEREFVLENAQAVTVVTNPADSHTNATTFGAAMTERLAALSASATRWSAWRDPQLGWMIGLEFSSHDVAHHAQWLFDHKKRVLEPHNADAKSLSKQGDVGDRLIPKLRAVENTGAQERFDSGAFQPQPNHPTEADTAVLAPAERDLASDTGVNEHPAAFTEPLDEQERREIIESRAVTREQTPVDFGETADLLEALRKRRGERDSQPQPRLDAEPEPLEPAATQPLASIETLPDRADQAETTDEQPARRGRQSVPSWDDILFGTRSDEDPF